MKFIVLKSFISLLLISLSINISSCKKDTTSSDDQDIIEENWDLVLTFNIVDPDVYTFYGSGDIVVTIDGDDVTITGVFAIGNLSYNDLIFEGILNRDQFTLLTDSYQVQFEFDGVLYTETIDITVPTFTFGENEISGDGDIFILKNPGATTESGTFTFTATKK